MRPVLFLVALGTLIYLVSDAFSGHLQYSFPGVIGNDIYAAIGNNPNFFGHSFFMDLVYTITFLVVIVMLYAGLKMEGKRKSGKS